MKQHLCTCLALLISASSLASAQQQTQPAPPRPKPAPLLFGCMGHGRGPHPSRCRSHGRHRKSRVGSGATDFSLLENGRPQNIISFHAFDGHGTSSEPPAKIILVIDTIALPEALARVERVAAISYLKQGGEQLAHPVSVFSLTETGLWTLAPSSNGNLLAHQIEHNNFTLLHHNVGWRRGPVPAG